MLVNEPGRWGPEDDGPDEEGGLDWGDWFEFETYLAAMGSHRRSEDAEGVASGSWTRAASRRAVRWMRTELGTFCPGRPTSRRIDASPCP